MNSRLEKLCNVNTYVSVFGVILVHIIPHLDRIRTRITPNTNTFYAVTVAERKKMNLGSSNIEITGFGCFLRLKKCYSINTLNNPKYKNY